MWNLFCSSSQYNISGNSVSLKKGVTLCEFKSFEMNSSWRSWNRYFKFIKYKNFERNRNKFKYTEQNKLKYLISVYSKKSKYQENWNEFKWIAECLNKHGIQVNSRKSKLKICNFINKVNSCNTIIFRHSFYFDVKWIQAFLK